RERPAKKGRQARRAGATHSARRRQRRLPVGGGRDSRYRRSLDPAGCRGSPSSPTHSIAVFRRTIDRRGGRRSRDLSFDRVRTLVLRKGPAQDTPGQRVIAGAAKYFARRSDESNLEYALYIGD